VTGTKRSMKHAAASMTLAMCIGCGCDDRRACRDGFDEPCHWVEVNRVAGIGVCSVCTARSAMHGNEIMEAYGRLCELLRKVRLSGGHYRARS
jgi:hypothetical protein